MEVSESIEGSLLMDKEGALLLAEKNIFKSPHDRKSWDKLLELGPSREAFERVLLHFPTCSNYWLRYAEFELSNHNTAFAGEVFERGVACCSRLDLWLAYVKYTRSNGMLYEVINVLKDAVDKIGCDFRSGVLWSKLLSFFIKIYNVKLRREGNSQLLLFDPATLGPSKEKPSFLLPTPEEERTFLQNVPNTQVDYLTKYGDISQLRNFYHDWLSTATEYSEIAWLSYCNFERNVGSNMTLANKFITDFSSSHLTAKIVYQKLCSLFENLDSPTYPVPPSNAEAYEEFQKLQETWLEILCYELTNPLELPLERFQKRMIFYFRSSLLDCPYHAEMWCMYAQFLFAHDFSTEAFKVLRLAIDKFLRDDEFLVLMLAKHLESQNMIEEADKLYKEILAPRIGRKGGDSESDNEGKKGVSTPIQEGISHPQSASHILNGAEPTDKNTEVASSSSSSSSAALFINYLGFVRRNYGMEACRQAFRQIWDLPECTFCVFVYMALSEWICVGSMARAIQTFRSGMSRFHSEADYVLAFSEFLLNSGNINGFRELLSKSISDIYKVKGEIFPLLWDRWVDFEEKFGDRSTLDLVRSFRIDQLVGASGEGGDLTGLDNFPAWKRGGEGGHAKLSGSDTQEGKMANPPPQQTPGERSNSYEAHVLSNLKLSEKSMDSKLIQEAKKKIFQRQFYGGEPFKLLVSRFSFQNAIPRSFAIENKNLSENQSPPSNLMAGSTWASFLPSAPQLSADDGKPPSLVNNTAAFPDYRSDTVSSPSGQTRLFGSKMRLLIARPDVSQMTMLSSQPFFNPLHETAPLGGAMGVSGGGGESSSSPHHTAYNSSSLAHSSFSPPSSAAADLHQRFLPAKGICDFFQLLPKPRAPAGRANAATPNTVVEYLINSLSTVSLPQVSLNKLKPIPVDDLLLLKSMETPGPSKNEYASVGASERRSSMRNKREAVAHTLPHDDTQVLVKNEVSTEDEMEEDEEEDQDFAHSEAVPASSGDQSQEREGRVVKRLKRDPNSNFFTHSKYSILHTPTPDPLL